MDTHDLDIRISHIQSSKNVLTNALSRLYLDKGILRHTINTLITLYGILFIQSSLV